MSTLSRLNRKRQTGFGLVEIMVAMVIGMFGVMVMMQVLSVSEDQKRTTTGGNDAMNEGVMALYAVQNDVRTSGFGIADANVMGCSLVLRYNAGTPGNSVVLSALAPVTINPQRVNPVTGVLAPLITGQDANTDTLLLVYGTGEVMSQGDGVLGTSGTDGVVQTPSEFAVNDLVIAVPQTRAANCNNLMLTRVTAKAPAAPSAITLSYLDAAANSAAFNPAAVAPAPVNPIAQGGRFFNLGQTLRAVGYAVKGGNLTTCDFGTTDCSLAVNWGSIANNIVSLRAQYGRDTAVAGAMDGIVDAYDAVSPNAGGITTAAAACEWFKISALRLAVVARSAQMEKVAVTAVGPNWNGVGAINVSADPNWQNYRYKVFQTTVPLRNISWLGIVNSPTGNPC